MGACRRLVQGAHSSRRRRAQGEHFFRRRLVQGGALLSQERQSPRPLPHRRRRAGGARPLRRHCPPSVAKPCRTHTNDAGASSCVLLLRLLGLAWLGLACSRQTDDEFVEAGAAQGLPPSAARPFAKGWSLRAMTDWGDMQVTLLELLEFGFHLPTYQERMTDWGDVQVERVTDWRGGERAHGNAGRGGVWGLQVEASSEQQRTRSNR